jgi:phosphoribosylglycinamide formyltransferase-1
MVTRIRVGVLASGRGTDLQSIIDASTEGIIDADVVVVMSDKKDAYALERAKIHDILGYFIHPADKTPEEFDDDIDAIATEHHCDLLVGAGFMRILTKDFVNKWYGKIINIHPALLPSFKGVHGQGDALSYGVKITGCTTHFMDDEMDHGPIILQAAVQVLEDDTEESLSERILKVEHQVLPRTIQLYAENRLHIQGRRVLISPGDSWKDTQKLIPHVLYPQCF